MKIRVFIKEIIFLILFSLSGCTNINYQDSITKYDELPKQVKDKFEEIFNSNAGIDSFIIFKCVDSNVSCKFQIKYSLFFGSDIVLDISNDIIEIPLDLTAVRIFVFYKNKIYFIKKSGFSKLEGGKLDEFLDYKAQEFSIYEVETN